MRARLVYSCGIPFFHAHVHVHVFNMKEQITIEKQAGEQDNLKATWETAWAYEVFTSTETINRRGAHEDE